MNSLNVSGNPNLVNYWLEINFIDLHQHFLVDSTSIRSECNECKIMGASRVDSSSNVYKHEQVGNCSSFR